MGKILLSAPYARLYFLSILHLNRDRSYREQALTPTVSLRERGEKRVLSPPERVRGSSHVPIGALLSSNLRWRNLSFI